jgi:hypothetical protein
VRIDSKDTAAGGAINERRRTEVLSKCDLLFIFDPFAPRRSLCYLLDDLCDAVCIFVTRAVVELAPEASVDDALLQTYIVTGSEVSSFPDRTRPKVVGTGLQGDEFTFGRAEENGSYKQGRRSTEGFLR